MFLVKNFYSFQFLYFLGQSSHFESNYSVLNIIKSFGPLELDPKSTLNRILTLEMIIITLDMISLTQKVISLT